MFLARGAYNLAIDLIDTVVDRVIGIITRTCMHDLEPHSLLMDAYIVYLLIDRNVLFFGSLDVTSAPHPCSFAITEA
jgi:hypothetical protein